MDFIECRDCQKEFSRNETPKRTGLRCLECFKISEKIRKNKKEYRETQKKQEINKEKRREYSKKYKETHKEIIKQRGHERTMKKQGFTENEIKLIEETFDEMVEVKDLKYENPLYVLTPKRKLRLIRDYDFRYLPV